jgi:hypothetical protein
VRGGYLALKQFGGLAGLTGNFPTTAAGFQGKVALMEAYLRRYPPAEGVYTPQNQLSWHLANDLSFAGVPVHVQTPSGTQVLLRNTQWGYPVAGIQNISTVPGVVQLVQLPTPSQPVYYVLASSPDTANTVLIGKFVQQNGQWVLWQVFEEPESTAQQTGAQPVPSNFQWANAPQAAAAVAS